MAFGVTGYKGGNGVSSASTVTVNISSTPAGALILVWASSRAVSFTGTPVTDSASNSYTQIYSKASTTSTIQDGIAYYLANAGAGITSVTVDPVIGEHQRLLRSGRRR